MAQAGQTKPKVLDTGVPNLDLVLGGGLQQHNSYLFVGGPGTGKSVLVQQIAFHRAALGERVLLVTGLDEPHHNLLEHLATLRFVDAKLIGPQVETVSIVPFLDRPVPEKINVLRKTVLNARPKLVTIDGLRSFEAYLGGLEGVFEFLYGLTSWFAVEGITLLLTKDCDPDAWAENPEYDLVDGIIALRRDLVDGRTVRRLWVRKMRGQNALDGTHAFTLDERGVTVWPRPQAVFHLQDRPAPGARLPFGIESLDAMLGGGLPEASTTLVAGDPGAGKTMLALAFMAGGAQRGEPGLWVGFRESPAQLRAMGEAWGADLASAVQFMVVAPLELDPGEMAWLLQQRMAEVGARRLVVDGAEALAGAFPGERQCSEFLAWLSRFAPQQGVTSLITQSAPAETGPELRLATTPLASLAQNVIVLRHVRQEDRLRRAIAILRLASPDYDAAIRELVVTRSGIAVGDVLGAAGQPAEQASAELAGGRV